MASLKDLIVKIGADTRGLTQGVDTAQAKLSSFGSTATSVGASLSMSLTAPIVAAGAGILAAAGNFEAGMNKVAAISGATGSDLEALTAQAKELGASTKFSASQAAEGMSFLAMAGYSVNETMTAMPGLLSLAAASGMELGQAADIASNILSGFRLNADQAGRAADVLAKAAASSNTDVTQLGQAMKYVAPVAANVGMTIEQTAAYIGKLGDAGIQAEMAGTSLRGMIAGLVAPSGEAAKVLEKLGVSTADASGQMRPLRDILEQLKTSGASTAEMFAIFGRENASAALVLQESLPSYDSLVEKLQSSSGAAGEMAATLNQGVEGSFNALASAVEGLSIAIADAGLIDWATSLVISLTDIIREVGKTSPELLKMGTIAAGVVAAAGPLLVFIGSMSTALSAILPTITAFGGGLAALSGGPVTLAIAALVGLSGALLAVQDDSSTVVKEWKTAWDSIKSIASTVGSAVKTEIKNAWSAIVTFSGPIFDQIVRIADTAMGIVRELLQLPGVKQSVEVVWVGIKAIVEGTWEAIKGIISGALSVIEGVLKAALAVLTGDWQGFKDGLMLIVEGMWTAITGVFSGGVTAIKNTLIGLKDSVLSVFSDIGDELVGNSIVPDEIVDPTIGEFERMGAGAKQATHQLALDVDTEFSAVGTTLATNKTEFETWRNGIDDAVKNLDIGGKIFSGAFAPGKWKETLKGIATDFLDLFLKPIKDGINDFIAGGLKDLSGALSGIGSQLSGIFTGGGGAAGSTTSTQGSGGGLSSILKGLGSGGGDPVTGAISAGIQLTDMLLSHFGRKRAEATANAIEENTRLHMLLFADYRASVGFFQNNELQEQTANLEYIVGNGDAIKEAVWKIKDILAGGVAVSAIAGSAVSDLGTTIATSTREMAVADTPGMLRMVAEAVMGTGPSRARSNSELNIPTPGSFTPTRARDGQPLPTAEDIGNATRDALTARNPLAVIAAELGNPLAQLATGSNFMPAAIEAQTTAIETTAASQEAATTAQTEVIRTTADATDTRLSMIYEALQSFVTEVRTLLNRDIVLNIDGQEIARAVGAGQESLRATA